MIGYARKHNAFFAFEETPQKRKEKREAADEPDNTR